VVGARVDASERAQRFVDTLEARLAKPKPRGGLAKAPRELWSGFRGPIDHQPGDKDGDDGEQQHAEEARADTSNNHLVDHHASQQHDATNGVKLSCMALTAPLEESVVTVAKRADVAVPKRISFPSMLPPDCNVLGV